MFGYELGVGIVFDSAVEHEMIEVRKQIRDGRNQASHVGGYVGGRQPQIVTDAIEASRSRVDEWREEFAPKFVVSLKESENAMLI